MFRIGQKVVCVEAAHTNSFECPELTDGAIYTVRWVGLDSWYLCVRLEELLRDKHPITGDFVDHRFRDWPLLASRFRPAVERKTDISIFTKMLTSNKRELALTSPHGNLTDGGAK